MTKVQAKKLAKARKGAWSPEAIAKRQATFAAKRAARANTVPVLGDGGKVIAMTGRGKREKTTTLVFTGEHKAQYQNVKDAIVVLEHAEKAIIKAIASGGKRISVAETYMLLALKTLRGET